MTSLALLLAVLGHVAVLAHAYEGCTVRYGRRGCVHRVVEGVLVQCDGKGKERDIPTNLPQDTVYLSLVNFKLSTLKKQDFTANIQTVECLQLVDSGITKIEPDAFSTMTTLAELSLENTNIGSDSLSFINHASFEPELLAISGSPYLHHVNFQATKNLNHIKTLVLTGNKVTHINKHIYAELKSLETLDLSDNHLKTLHWEELKALEFLKKLYLHGNRFQTVPITIYEVFYAVNELTLSDNPFHCNCKLRWLREFYGMVFDKEVDYEAIECHTPYRRKFKDISLSRFTCTQPEKPKVTYYQIDDGRYEFNCTSHGDPSPTLTLTLPDGRKVITPPSEDISKLDPLTPQILTRYGEITCEARNSEGNSTHTAHVPPPVAYSGVTRISMFNYMSTLLLSATLATLLRAL